ncbi:MAG: dockerin type I domain-containing protein [Chloroflexota bacterium]
MSDPVSVTLTRDTTPPLITPNVIPETLSGYIYRFQGTSEDPTPTGGRTQRVEVQFDDPTGDWLVVPLFQTGTFWSYSWPLPEEDGVTHTVRFRATDFGDNTTVTNFESFVVDTVAPLVEVTSDTTQGLDTGQTLAGTISDGSGISRLTITLYPAVGDAIVQDIIPVNGVWSYSAGQPIGEYSYIIEAADLAGNRRVIGPLPLTIVDQLTTATLTGSLTFVGRGTPPNAFWVEAVDVTVHPVGVVTPTFSFNTTTDQNGQFTVNGITPGTYDVAVKPATGLRVVQELTLAAGGNSADFGTVPGGDVNGDNEVTLIDFSILSASFNLSEGDPGYDLRADLNGDNQVTALDFSILASNFNQSGETVGD